jgi:hypothetical protein
MALFSCYEKQMFTKSEIKKQLESYTNVEAQLWSLTFLLAAKIISIEEAQLRLKDPALEYPKKLPKIFSTRMRNCILAEYSTKFIAGMDSRYILEGLIWGISAKAILLTFSGFISDYFSYPEDRKEVSTQSRMIFDKFVKQLGYTPTVDMGNAFSHSAPSLILENCKLTISKIGPYAILSGNSLVSILIF